MFWGKIFPPREKWANFPQRGRFSLWGMISFEVAFAFPRNALVPTKWRAWEKGAFVARGKIHDFPPRGKIYLKPFFCLKRCQGKENLQDYQGFSVPAECMHANLEKQEKTPVLASKLLSQNQPRKSKQSRKGRTGLLLWKCVPSRTPKTPKNSNEPKIGYRYSKARRPWSANRELRGWRKRGCREGCQKAGWKRRINRDLEGRKAHKPWIREGHLDREVQTVN